MTLRAIKRDVNMQRAIIGANYGDEGKGLITDYFSAFDSPAVNIRFNGGAQAGHTAYFKKTRHVFHHFGSGTLSGADTYLSKFFVTNPILFLPEHEALLKLMPDLPEVRIDPRSPVTTPFEMLINQWLEDKRGNARHGSCGVGFGETWEREEKGITSLVAGDLLREDILEIKLKMLKDWFFYRMGVLGLTQSIHPPSIIDRFRGVINQFLPLVKIDNLSRPSMGTALIFEGAQGLLLDQGDVQFNPHVTRSYTGLTNVKTILNEWNLDERLLEIYYVTRPYLTRHGAGPLPRELPAAPFSKIKDKTNVNHPFQGKLRFAHLDIEALKQRIHKDLMKLNRSDERFNLVLTCCDQLPDNVRLYQGEQVLKVKRKQIHKVIAEHVGADFVYRSDGPHQHDITVCVT